MNSTPRPRAAKATGGLSAPWLWSARAASLVAVLLLSYASITSVVMQAAMTVAPMSMDMAGMDMAGMDMSHMDMSGGGSGETKGKAESCAFCAAAAHAPILTATVPVPSPSAVAWLVVPVRQIRGERGPPSFRATARGPPPPFQSA